MPSKNLIYALVDPRTKETRYIGQSSYGLTRARRHWTPHYLKADAHLWSTRWIETVLATGLQPEIRVLAECKSIDELDTGEIFWIAWGRAVAWPLTNHTEGGRSHRGFRPSEETRAKMSAASKGRLLSSEHKAAISDAQRGRVRSPEFREKIKAAALARGISPEIRAKIVAANKGKTLSAKHKAQLSATHKGKPLNAAHRAKLSAAQTGMKYTEEARAKMRASRLAFLARQRQGTAVQ